MYIILQTWTDILNRFLNVGVVAFNNIKPCNPKMAIKKDFDYFRLYGEIEGLSSNTILEYVIDYTKMKVNETMCNILNPLKNETTRAEIIKKL